MAGAMGNFVYIGDVAASNCVIRTTAATAALTGGVASALPTSKLTRVKLRYLLARHPVTHRERRITVCDPASALWTGATTVISLRDYGAVASPATDYNIEGRVGEKRLA